MQLRERTISDLAEFVCGASGSSGGFEWPNFPYRSGPQLTKFFRQCDLDYRHSGTRCDWVIEVLTQLNIGPSANPAMPSDSIVRVIEELMDAGDFQKFKLDRALALIDLNSALSRDGLEAYFDGAGRCLLKNGAGQVTATIRTPQRAWTEKEIKYRKDMDAYLGKCSEDELIENILEPLFQQLGFKRITVTGHRDKALEYGKDAWMKIQLPTRHYLYFGIQAKRGKIDSAGKSNDNVAEILNQVLMMLGHEVFDPETNTKHLVDHVFIISANEITKPAKNWLGGKLDSTQRRSVMFMDRTDLLDLSTLTNLRLPHSESDQDLSFDEMPF